MINVASYLASLPSRKSPESIAKHKDKTDTLEYFIQGVNAAGDSGIVYNDPTIKPADVAVILGWVHEHGKTASHLTFRQSIVTQQQSLGKHTVIADSNLFLYKNTSNPGYRLRYSFDGVFPNTGQYCDSAVDPSRWASIQADSGLVLKDYRTGGNHLLICLQRDGGWSMGGVNVVNWCVDAIKKLRQYTDRPIRIRSHPGDKKAIDYCINIKHQLESAGITKFEFSRQGKSLIEDLENCWAVINHNSSPAVGAAIEGYPVFITDVVRSQCRDIANTDFSQIETPNLPDRLPWVQRISMFHWTHAELRSGQCWMHMRQFI